MLIHRIPENNLITTTGGQKDDFISVALSMSVPIEQAQFQARLIHLWPQWLETPKQRVESIHPKTAISLRARLKEMTRTLSLEVSVHFTSSICESMGEKGHFFRDTKSKN